MIPPAPYTFYKKSAALRISPIMPKAIENGDYTNTEPGAVLIELAKGVGQRKYDWEHKITLALNQLELGGILAEYGLKKQELKFYHDPNKGKNNEGQEGKTYTMKRTDSKGHAIGLYHKRKAGEDNSGYIVLNDAEYMVFSTLIKTAIPLIQAWN